MRTYLAITKALSDPARVRALLALRAGELCLCQIIELLGLAPSTVSRHMDLLHRAGLVERRKDGRWQHFRLSRTDDPLVAGALRWTLAGLGREAEVRQDQRRLCCVRKKKLAEVSTCYR